MAVTFNMAVHGHADYIADLVTRKQHDYGPKNILNCPAGVETGLIVRLHDKLARIANLTKTGTTPNNESIEDTWRDIAGYALIGLMVQNGEFELPLEEPVATSITTNP